MCVCVCYYFTLEPVSFECYKVEPRFHWLTSGVQRFFSSFPTHYFSELRDDTVCVANLTSASPKQLILHSTHTHSHVFMHMTNRK